MRRRRRHRGGLCTAGAAPGPWPDGSPGHSQVGPELSHWDLFSGTSLWASLAWPLTWSCCCPQDTAAPPHALSTGPHSPSEGLVSGSGQPDAPNSRALPPTHLSGPPPQPGTGPWGQWTACMPPILPHRRGPSYPSHSFNKYLLSKGCVWSWGPGGWSGGHCPVLQGAVWSAPWAWATWLGWGDWRVSMCLCPLAAWC